MGYWGERGTKATWANPQQTPEGSRQHGGWYYNPGTGSVDRWYTGSPPSAPSASTGGGGGGGGGGGYTGPSATDLAAAFEKGRQETFAEQERIRKEAEKKEQAAITDWTSRFTEKIESFTPWEEYAMGIEQDIGLPAMEEAAFGLSETLAGIPDVVKAQAQRTGGMSAAQMQRLIQSRQAEMSPQVQEALRLAQRGQAEVSQRLGYEMTEREQALAPYATEAEMINASLARQSTMYTTQMESQLDSLLEKYRVRGDLTSQEMQMANNLAQLEAEYEHEKNLLNMGTEQVTINGRRLLINSQTGETIRDLGPASGEGAYTSPYGIMSEYQRWLQERGLAPTQTPQGSVNIYDDTGSYRILE